MEEKILNLLESSVEEDSIIGFHLLFSTYENPMDFFNKYGASGKMSSEGYNQIHRAVSPRDPWDLYYYTCGKYIVLSSSTLAFYICDEIYSDHVRIINH